ncbi:MAG: MSMEG_4193 family putative phosphomutase [Chloroflexi bacterium]|nr:MSMEG_4193 family putative phosphomutase [Chloroflexota bacterium]
MTTLVLIRHAHTDWADKRLASRLEGITLNAEGYQQAAELPARLEGLRLDVIYSSPMQRCLETAQALAQARGLPVNICDGLAEVDYGKWTGMTLEELRKEEGWKVVQIYPSGMVFPEGEAMRDVQNRMVNTLEELARRHPDQVIAAFSHSDIIRIAIAYYAGIHLDLFQRLAISPASVTIISLSPFGPRIVRVNDTGRWPDLAKKPETPKEQAQAESTAGSEAHPNGAPPPGASPEPAPAQ